MVMSSARVMSSSNSSEKANVPRLRRRCMRAMQPETVKLSRRISRLAMRSPASCARARIQRRLNRGTFAFSELFDEDMTRAELITMFMALLEMVKLGRVAVKQEHAYEEIYLSQHAPEPPAPAQEQE